jgi:hypothetical protein
VTSYNSEGKAISTQTVDWTGGAETQDVALPDGTDHYEVSVTFGKADSNGDYVAAIADAFVIPKITLKPTDKVLSVVQSAFDSQTNPVTYLTNADSMTATYEDGTSIFSMDATGGDRLRGYSEDVAVIPSKSVETSIDNGNQVANLTYTAKVEERSNITSTDVWQTAVAEGDIAADTSCTWYDLLPKGVVPDLSSITLRDGDTISDAYTIPNYKGPHAFCGQGQSHPDAGLLRRRRQHLLLRGRSHDHVRCDLLVRIDALLRQRHPQRDRLRER